jgi:hypothetical protein
MPPRCLSGRPSWRFHGRMACAGVLRAVPPQAAFGRLAPQLLLAVRPQADTTSAWQGRPCLASNVSDTAASPDMRR